MLLGVVEDVLAIASIPNVLPGPWQRMDFLVLRAFRAVVGIDLGLLVGSLHLNDTCVPSLASCEKHSALFSSLGLGSLPY